MIVQTNRWKRSATLCAALMGLTVVSGCSWRQHIDTRVDYRDDLPNLRVKHTIHTSTADPVTENLVKDLGFIVNRAWLQDGKSGMELRLSLSVAKECRTRTYTNVTKEYRQAGRRNPIRWILPLAGAAMVSGAAVPGVWADFPATDDTTSGVRGVMSVIGASALIFGSIQGASRAKRSVYATGWYERNETKVYVDEGEWVRCDGPYLIAENETSRTLRESHAFLFSAGGTTFKYSSGMDDYLVKFPVEMFPASFWNTSRWKISIAPASPPSRHHAYVTEVEVTGDRGKAKAAAAAKEKEAAERRAAEEAEIAERRAEYERELQRTEEEITEFMRALEQDSNPCYDLYVGRVIRYMNWSTYGCKIQITGVGRKKASYVRVDDECSEGSGEFDCACLGREDDSSAQLRARWELCR